MEFTIAGRTHECEYNSDHRIEKGMPRLSIHCEGGQYHYCLPCAKVLFDQGMRHLHLMLEGGSRLERG